MSVGCNVNEVNFDSQTEKIATSLKKEFNKNFNREEIILKIVEKIKNEILINLTSQTNENFY